MEGVSQGGRFRGARPVFLSEKAEEVFQEREAPIIAEKADCESEPCGVAT
jgi:hypothetical protein